MAQKEQKIQITKYYCDICKNELGSKPNFPRCSICGRELCKKCMRYDPTNHGDYPGAWCKICLQLWETKYERLLEKVENECWDKECKIMSRLKKESKNETDSEKQFYNNYFFFMRNHPLWRNFMTNKKK